MGLRTAIRLVEELSHSLVVQVKFSSGLSKQL